jgi:hypothetical protein
MKDVQAESAHLNGLHLRQAGRPSAAIHIAAHGDCRRDTLKFIENISAANIAGMDDQGNAVQRRDCFGAQQAVRVGDQPDNGLRMIDVIHVTVPVDNPWIAGCFLA